MKNFKGELRIEASAQTWVTNGLYKTTLEILKRRPRAWTDESEEPSIKEKQFTAKTKAGTNLANLRNRKKPYDDNLIGYGAGKGEALRNTDP